jgi:sugar phosphate isomerase/epimerase
VKRLAGLVQNLRLADELGAQGVIALPIRPPVRLPDLSPVADEDALITQLVISTLTSAIEQTAGARAAIFLEPLNRYEARYLRTVAHAADLCRAVGHPRAQLMADFFHMSIEEADIGASLAAVSVPLGHIHLADSNRLLPGLGHTDFVEPFRTLRGNGYRGWMALECRVAGDPGEMLPAAVRLLKNCWERAAEKTD